MSKVIVAGSRDITDFTTVQGAINDSPFTPTEIVSGGADGVDALGEKWSRLNSVDAKTFQANWNKHGKSAGPKRNKKMANYADAAVIVWDGESAGTRNMLENALASRLDVYVQPVGYEGIIPNDLTEDELLRRFPELKLIDDVWIRSETVKALLAGYPDYNWETSAASRHHPEDERNEHGQWLHVKRVYSAYEDIARSYRQQRRLSKREVELGKAAVFLHDMFKYGIPPKKHSSGYGTHDTLAAEFVRNFTDLPESVARACDTHSGGWGNDTVPETALEDAVHMADYMPSRDDSNKGVYQPTEEIEDSSDMLIDNGKV